MRAFVLMIIISATALAAAGSCAKKAEEVIVVPRCDCEEPCADCVCEKEAKARAAAERNGP